MKKKKYFYRTGFKYLFSFFDIFKFKVRIFDYDDSRGIFYYYFWHVKIFWIELARMKYRMGKGLIKYRKMNWR